MMKKLYNEGIIIHNNIGKLYLYLIYLSDPDSSQSTLIYLKVLSINI